MSCGVGCDARCQSSRWLGEPVTAVGIAASSPDVCDVPSPWRAAHSPSPEPPGVCLPGADDVERRCWQQFTEATTHLYAALNSELIDAHGLTLLDVMLLRLIVNSHKESARMGELAQALAISPSRVSQQAQRLESQGLLSRSKSPQDRRVVIASITAQGRVVLRPALKTYARGVRRLYLSPLSRQQMTAVGDSSRRVDDALKEPQQPKTPNQRLGVASLVE